MARGNDNLRRADERQATELAEICLQQSVTAQVALEITIAQGLVGIAANNAVDASGNPQNQPAMVPTLPAISPNIYAPAPQGTWAAVITCPTTTNLPSIPEDWEAWIDNDHFSLQQ